MIERLEGRLPLASTGCSISTFSPCALNISVILLLSFCVHEIIASGGGLSLIHDLCLRCKSKPNRGGAGQSTLSPHWLSIGIARMQANTQHAIEGCQRLRSSQAPQVDM